MRLLATGLMVAVLTGAAAAQTAPPAQPPVLDQVYACAPISGERERLACYDAAVGRLRQAQTSGELVAVDRAQAQQIQREAFGFQLPSLPRLFSSNTDPRASGDAQSIALIVQGVGYRGDGKAIITMQNGQVWEQIDTNSASRVRSGGEVTVRHGALGSFMMSVAAGGPAIRVRRRE